MSILSLATRLKGLLADQFGLDPTKTLRALWNTPRFARDLYRFRSVYKGRLRLYPCLHDWHEEGGTARGEYFWQDLYVARKIYSANPVKHVDIGSRIDGFVAHVASYRQLEVIDIRPITATIPGIEFKQGNLMNLAPEMVNYCDSLSCLHALEHFGLGRYGDPIEPYGHEAGLGNMARMVRNGGTLYLSVPVGFGRVEFNGQRVLDPGAILVLARTNDLTLKELAYITRDDVLVESTDPMSDIQSLATQRYSLGIFTFQKV
jgi:SAM-dependent methyltransferase